MLNNCFLNEYLRNYRNRGCFNSLQSPFITPCEALNKYIKDPCSMFIENIIPIEPIPPIPPLPPIPMPPFPPGPMIGSRAQFNSPQTLMISGDKYRWNTVNIDGNAIEHIDGTDIIMLAPNTTFEYSFISLTTTGRDEEINVGVSLILVDADGLIVVGLNFVMGNGLNDTMVQVNGRFTTGNAPVFITAQFIIQPVIINGLTEASLMIAEILT